jgi:hypothetical protein
MLGGSERELCGKPQLGVDRVEMRSEPCDFMPLVLILRITGRHIPEAKRESQREKQHQDC